MFFCHRLICSPLGMRTDTIRKCLYIYGRIDPTVRIHSRLNVCLGKMNLSQFNLTNTSNPVVTFARVEYVRYELEAFLALALVRANSVAAIRVGRTYLAMRALDKIYIYFVLH